MKTVTLHVNGVDHVVEVEERAILTDVLRDQLHLYGTKKGCGTGECGACTIIYDGEAVNSCLIFAYRAEGHDIITVEGLAEEDGKPNLLQRKFIENGAVQCGYCGPGMLMSATVLLNNNPQPTEKEIRQAISGNICRCSGYVNIVKSIMAAAKEAGGEK